MLQVHIKTYLSKAIELDKAMEHLLSNLNVIDNTVIAMFSDHRPLQMPPKYLNTYSEIDRMPQFEMDKTPFIIYTPIQIPEINNKVSSTLDMAPHNRKPVRLETRSQTLHGTGYLW